MEVSYESIRKKFPNAYCVDNLRRIYKQNKELSMSFTDFLFYVEDYYLLKYAGMLSKTAWWLFSLLRYLVRYDGFVKLSYADIVGYFKVDGQGSISKPTFFKYVDELESLGIVRRYNNKKLFNMKYQNDSNTYVVISCVDEIVDICLQVTDRVSFRELVLGADVSVPKRKKKKIHKADTKSDSEWYAEISDYYSEVWPVVEDFFKFLGGKNKTGRISLSRKVKIARYFYERDDYIENVEYAITETIKRGIDKEAYMFAILRSFNDGEVAPVVSELRNKYEHGSPQEMTESEYEEQKAKLLDGSDRYYYRELLAILSKRDTLNNYEQRLYDAAMVISRKMEIHDRHFEDSNERMELLEDKYGIIERYTYDRKFNKIIRWFYRNDKPVPLDVVKDVKRKHKDLFVFYKYEIPDRRYYNGL